MDSIDTKSKINSSAAIPTGGTRKSSSGSGGDDGVSFASLLGGGGLAGMKSGGGMQSGLEDSLSGALDRNPDEAPEKAPEQAAKHDYNDDTPEQSPDDGYYNKTDNSHDNLNDNLDDAPRESVHTQAATDDHSDDYNNANDEPVYSEAPHTSDENVAQEGSSANTDEPKEAQTEETASETGTESASKSDANANGGATVETLNELSQNQALPEQVAAVAGTQTKDAQGRTNATDGLNTATAAINAEKSTKPQAVQQNGGEKTNNQGKTGENLNQALQSDGKQEKAKVASNTVINTTAKPLQDQSQQATQAKVETQPREVSNVARQAAEISRAIGGNKEVSVNVSVQSEKETLISRPRTAISLAADANKANGGLNNTQAQQNPSTNNQMSQQNGAQNQNAQNMALVGQQAQVAGRQVAANTVNNAPSAVASAQSTSAISGDSGSLNTSSQVGEGLNARQANATAKTNSPANSPTASKQPAAEQVSVQITKAIKVGADRISIQLRPASMGRIDVQMEMGADGRVSAVITADNKETLDLLQRDQRSLERALQDSGMQTDSGSLSFNLRGQNDHGAGDALAENNANAKGNIEDEEEPLDALLSSEFNQNNKATDDGRIDIHA